MLFQCFRGAIASPNVKRGRGGFLITLRDLSCGTYRVKPPAKTSIPEFWSVNSAMLSIPAAT
ncbi:hypothetical protein SAMN04489740_2883 [Arthrobacter alpinus]|uniref:Uncharacterized protein n=1 Tax=Arthrobacter alpinus TaxID=656366 RepID=A0A1H5MFA3_9MICC|nr:hypothetical protein SAMN04489740_2883 [Arthrobacter alpinus]